MPGPAGGFVTSYTDVTEYVRAQRALEEANESLEKRVQQRTRALQQLNEELLIAKATAERANQGKTRFLAAASHDLLQPLHAAGCSLGRSRRSWLTASRARCSPTSSSACARRKAC
jgi:signal transduction histidine kinase